MCAYRGTSTFRITPSHRRWTGRNCRRHYSCLLTRPSAPSRPRHARTRAAGQCPGKGRGRQQGRMQQQQQQQQQQHDFPALHLLRVTHSQRFGCSNRRRIVEQPSPKLGSWRDGYRQGWSRDGRGNSSYWFRGPMSASREFGDATGYHYVLCGVKEADRARGPIFSASRRKG